MSLGLSDLKKKAKAATTKTAKVSSSASQAARPWDASGLSRAPKMKNRLEANDAVMSNEWSDSHTTYLHDFETFAEAKIEQAQAALSSIESKIKRATSGPLKILGFALRAVQNQK